MRYFTPSMRRKFFNWRQDFTFFFDLDSELGLGPRSPKYRREFDDLKSALQYGRRGFRAMRQINKKY